jgi:hypothetical protein
VELRTDHSLLPCPWCCRRVYWVDAMSKQLVVWSGSGGGVEVVADLSLYVAGASIYGLALHLNTAYVSAWNAKVGLRSVLGPHSHTHAHSNSHSTDHTHIQTPMHARTLTHTHIHTETHIHTQTNTHIHSLSHSLTLALTLSHTPYTLTHTLSLTHTLTLKFPQTL